MRLHATGRDLIITEKERLISGSINIYTCEFTFDESWDGYMVTAVFSTANRLVNKAVVDGKCEIPTEVLRPNSRLRIGIFGNDGVRTRPTTYSEWLPVEQGADTGGRTGRPPEPTVYEEWMNALDKQHDEWAKAEAEREAAEKLRGNSAVYVGSGVMPEGFNIQIDPEGEYVFGGPKIENGTWWVWDDETGDYMDTGVSASGPPGKDGEDSVFIAQYGKTTLAELHKALDEGKVIFCKDGVYITPTFSAGSSSVTFYRNDNNNLIITYCNKNGWNKTTRPLAESKLEETLCYVPQTLTEEQKAQARANIGAAAVGEGGNDVELDEIVEAVLAALPKAEEAEF